jgi:Protein of unknown function (DUF3617)
MKNLLKVSTLIISLIFSAVFCLNGCSTEKAQLKTGTYMMKIESPAQYGMPSQSYKECITPSDLEWMKAYPGPVPRTQPGCELRNYKIEDNHITYEQLCKDDNHKAGGDLVIKWDFVLTDQGYEGTMQGVIPRTTTELKTHIHAKYLNPECVY